MEEFDWFHNRTQQMTEMPSLCELHQCVLPFYQH